MPLSLLGPNFIFRLALIDRRQLCANLSGIVPPGRACVGQTEDIQKVEPMMEINGSEMSTNMAVYHSGGHFLDICLYVVSCEQMSKAHL